MESIYKQYDAKKQKNPLQPYNITTSYCNLLIYSVLFSCFVVRFCFLFIL